MCARTNIIGNNSLYLQLLEIYIHFTAFIAWEKNKNKNNYHPPLYLQVNKQMKTSKIYGFHYPPQWIQRLYPSRVSPKYFWDSSGLCLPWAHTLPILLDALLTHGSHTRSSSASGGCWCKGQVGGKMRHIDCSTGGITGWWWWWVGWEMQEDGFLPLCSTLCWYDHKAVWCWVKERRDGKGMGERIRPLLSWVLFYYDTLLWPLLFLYRESSRALDWIKNTMPHTWPHKPFPSTLENDLEK